MREREPMTQTMKIPDVKNQLSSLVNEVYRKETRVLVEKAGIPVAALVSPDDLRRLAQLDRAWDERTKAIERFSRAFADVPTEEAEAEVARIIAERRRRRRRSACRRDRRRPGHQRLGLRLYRRGQARQHSGGTRALLARRTR